MNMLVSTSALASSTAIASEPDPIYAVIETHRRAWRESKAYFERHGDEGEENEARLSELYDLECEAAIEIANVSPTTLQGIRFALEYVHQCSADQYIWPSDIVEDGEERTRHGRDWAYFFHRNLAEALRQIA